MAKTNQLQRKREEYQKLDKRDRRRYWTDGILNNALYILMFIFIVYTAIKNKNFLSAGSIANIISLVAASLPMALGIALLPAGFGYLASVFSFDLLPYFAGGVCALLFLIQWKVDGSGRSRA